MVKTQIRPWDAVEHLETEEDMAANLEAALEDGDPALVAGVLGDIARAKGRLAPRRDVIGCPTVSMGGSALGARLVPPCVGRKRTGR